MKKIFLYTLLGAWMLLAMAACSNDDKGGDAFVNGKLNLTKGVQISLNFSDYNEDMEVDGTRSIKNDTLSREWVDLGNGMSAEITVQRDKEKSQPVAATRALPNDSYTMLAYDPSDHRLLGEISGMVSGGQFTPYPPSKNIYLEPNKSYDFVCFNSMVSRNGNILTVQRASSQYARIGRTTAFINNYQPRQEISFNMQPAASRMHIRLQGWMDFPAIDGALLASVSDPIPGRASYDASTGTWSQSEGETGSVGAFSFPASSGYKSTSTDYAYYLPTTDIGKMKFVLQGGGKIYNIPMNGGNLMLNSLKDPITQAVTTMQPATSYLVNVKLAYNFLYLMSDGSRGLFKATIAGGGTKTPIGVVISRSQHLAIALKDIDNNKYKWTTLPKPTNGFNTTRFNSNTPAFFTDMDGYNWTWNPAYSTDGTTIKGDNPNFPAFYAAGHYDPGVPITGKLVGKKWFLGSTGHWKYVYTALGLGNPSVVFSSFTYFPWAENIAMNAFTQVGGTSMVPRRYKFSTEGINHDTGSIMIWPGNGFWWNDNFMYYHANTVRPFIIYDE